MFVRQLDIQNFRTFSYAQLQLSPGINVMIGENATGKTTILEALSFFAFGRSFRAAQDKDLIQFGQTETRLRVVLDPASQVTELAAKISPRGKQVTVNRVTKRSLSEFLGHLYCVAFTPDDLAIVKEGPEERRRFLNFSMAQYIHGYIRDLHLYTQLLEKRNQLLKMRQTDTLAIWDMQLCEVAAKVVFARKNFCQRLAQHFSDQYGLLAGETESATLHYATDAEASVVEQIAQQLRESLQRALVRDSQRGFTSVGPHRDDLKITLQDRPAARFASQGQQRSLVLALKLAVVHMIFAETGTYPVLLLDDVLSELDLSRQQHLLSLLQSTQTVITTTHHHDAMQSGAKVFRVSHGIMQELT